MPSVKVSVIEIIFLGYLVSCSEAHCGESRDEEIKADKEKVADENVEEIDLVYEVV